MRILCHNVFWFQGAPFHTDQPQTANSVVINGLSEVYAEVRPDVICMQEVQNEDAFARMSSAVSLPGCYTPGRTLRQYGGMTLAEGVIGVADSATMDGDDLAVPQRVWQVCDVNGVRIGNIHLPSSRQLGSEGAAKKRVAELAYLVSENSAPDGRFPDVVVGDFNEGPGGAVCEFMHGAGYRDTSVLTGKESISTNIKGTGQGDYIWVHESLVPRLRSYHVIPRERLEFSEGEAHLSDHLALWIELDD